MSTVFINRRLTFILTKIKTTIQLPWFNQDGRTRTCNPLFPEQVRYQIALHPDNCNPITGNTWKPASCYVICSISPSQRATSDLLIAFETHRLVRRRPTFTRHWNIVESISFALSTPSFVLLIPISILISRLPGIQWRYALVLKLARWFYGSSRRILLCVDLTIVLSARIGYDTTIQLCYARFLGRPCFLSQVQLLTTSNQIANRHTIAWRRTSCLTRNLLEVCYYPFPARYKRP